MSLPLEVRVAAIEEGLLDVQDTQARLTPLAPKNEGVEELQLKFRALEEHLEDELLKTGKALRKDFREELSHLRQSGHQSIDHRAQDAAKQILEELQAVKTRLEELEVVVPDVKSLYSGLEVAVHRARDVKEVAPSALAAVQDELRQTQEVAEKLRDFKVDAATQAELEGRLKAMTAARGGVWFSESEALSPTHSQSSAAFRESRIKKDKKPVSRDKFGTHSGVVSEQQKEIETRADQWTT